MMSVRFATLAACLVAAAPAPAQPPAPPAAGASALAYADLADLTLAAQVVAIATVKDAVRLKAADAAGVAPGDTRFYVTGTVDALVSGRNGLPAAIDWLADVPQTPAGKPQKLKKRRVILLARPIAARPGTLQLVARGGQLDWSPDLERRVRAIVAQSLDRNAPPAIVGVGNAFHVPGSIPGESETQIFLRTKDGRPVSLSILRRPGEQPRWAVSLSEIVSDSAAAPQPDTLLWYRLACGLPQTLPDEAVADQAPEAAAAAREDFAVVRTALGPCARGGSR